MKGRRWARRRRRPHLVARRRLPPEVAAPPTARAGTIVGAGAPARHPGGATGRARVSLLTGLGGGPVLGSGQARAPAPDMVMVLVAVALAEVVMEVAAVRAEMETAAATAKSTCRQLLAIKSSTVKHVIVYVN